MRKSTSQPSLRPFFEWRSAVASALGPPKPTTRHVLLTLGLHMSPKGDSCYPSIDTLAVESGLSRRAVIEHLAIAEAAGWISKKERALRNGQAWRSMEYKATLPSGVTEQTVYEAGDRPSPPPLLESTEGGYPHAEGGDFDDTKVVTDGHPSTSLSTSRGHTPPKAPKEKAGPSAVAECWKAYAQGMKSRYGIEPPPSARSNGQLSQVVARIGADAAVRVAGYFLVAPEPFYTKRKHGLELLVRDCVGLWMDLQKQSGGSSASAPAATSSKVSLILEDGKALPLQEYPLGDHLDTAKKAVREYAKMISLRHPKYVAVQQGAERRQFTIDEARA